MKNISMSAKERKRLELLCRVREKLLRLTQVAALLGLSYRQVKRLWRRYQREGDAGLVHRLRGRPSPRRFDVQKRERIIACYRAEYGGWGPTLAAEKLAARNGLGVDHETLRRWLLAEGDWRRQRQRKGYRQWRPRKAHWGELVQMDGSHHDWFEGRRAKAVLMVMIDDATNRTWARFFETEDSRAAFEVFGDYVERYGLPAALYVDRDSIYRVDREATVEEQRAGSGPLTQFGRAMKTLGVRVILAGSPQAKGRVERRHQLLQDRLVKELRLEGIEDLKTANRFLQEQFLPALNMRFEVPVAEACNLHRPVPKDLRLEEVLCWQERRVVGRDWTVAWRHQWLQLSRAHRRLALAGRTIVVRELLDGRLQLLWQGQKLCWEPLPDRPRPTPKLQASRGIESGKSLTASCRPPAADHPWRRFGIAASQKYLRTTTARRAGGPSPQAPRPPRWNNNGKERNNSKKGDISKELRRGHS